MGKNKPGKLSRIEEWRRKQKENNRQKNQKYNEKNREKRAAAAREKRQHKKARVHQTHQHTMRTANSLKRAHKRVEKKIALEVKMEKKRQQIRERVEKFREKRKQTTDAQGADDCDGDAAGFTNRMAASRAVRKVTKSLPETPKKRAEIIQKISASPRTRKHLVKAGTLKTPEEEKETKSLRAMAADI